MHYASKEIYMDVTLTYHCNSERRSLPLPDSGMPMLFTLADCCTGADLVQVRNAADYAKCMDLSPGGYFNDPMQVRFASDLV
jgi:hypothetical protein